MPTGAGDSMHPSSVTYKSIVAYDGTAFEGFQRQKEGIRTVQASLEVALAAIGWQDRSILAAGRTDRGVHAQGQVISYKFVWGHSLEDLTRALNANLPMDIAIRETAIVPEDFHPRFSARSRHYRYTLFVDPVRQPLGERFAMRVRQAPDLALMQQAAKRLIGERDYRVFGPAPNPEGTTVRNILDARWSEGEGRMAFDIEADAFLQHMVRRITAALLEIGLGRMSLTEFKSLLNTPGVRWEGALAPSCGLCLMGVCYPSSSNEQATSRV
jgi:tRNA pseudouridine38-40 synthase